MRHQIWLEWFCRRAIETLDPSKSASLDGRPVDPRRLFNVYIEEGLQVLGRGKIIGPALEALWYRSLRPFTVPYRYPSTFPWTAAGNTRPPLGLLLTRDTVNDLGGANAPTGSIEALGAAYPQDQGLYIDVPSGALLLNDVQIPGLQLRAFFLPPMKAESFGKRCFIGLVTMAGSEQPYGRYCDVLSPLPVTSLRGSAAPVSDVTLVSLLDSGSEITELSRNFILLVLLYNLYGPKSSKQSIPAAPVGSLKKPIARQNESLFAITKLQAPLERFGRPIKRGNASSWSLTSRQDVAGYFKLQPHGPGGVLRKLIWVEPYIRGPDKTLARPHGRVL